MSVLLAASKASHASLPSRSLLLLSCAASINNNAAPYVVGPHRMTVTLHIFERNVGIRATSKQMRRSVNWN